MNYTPPPVAHAVPTSTEDAVLTRTRALCQRRILWLEHLASAAAAEPTLQSVQSRVLLDVDAPDAEAAFLAETLVLMRDGRIVQTGSYQDLAESPAEDFVREFVTAQTARLRAHDGSVAE